ncbi:hypothetical protein R3P38DRAFT_2472235, partial [Favolaschia claudopus]
SFDHACRLLRQEDGEAVRLNMALETLTKESIPLLDKLELLGVPQTFTHACAHAIGPLVCELKLAALAAQGVERRNVTFLQPVEEVHTGKRGRPAKLINVELLREAFSKKRNISIVDLAAVLGVHRNFLAKKMKEAGISKQYEGYTDAELDALISELKATKPDSGRRYVVGALRNKGLRVQKERV